MRLPLILISALLVLCTGARAADVTVFAAASLTEVIGDIADAFEDRTGLDVEISFAGSSVLARQIRRGAPADVIVSANTDWIDYLEDGNAIIARSRRVFAGNRLALVTREDNAEAAPSLAALAADPDFGLLAIGDPDHVPVGTYAKEALLELGLWERLSERAVRAGNTRAAMAYVQRAAAGYGIVYRTDALAFSGIRIIELLPAETHDPIRYEAAITFQGNALNGENARLFLAALLSPEAAGILGKAGFSTCPEDGC
ncbi:MAG: molybdate ABC transporter substrate-binding protein [Minwuia sp.]|uniref:molybdate ABC transporter substrate-binding protein n=1 Tax=Minwuia sp. TaxID=2493630 RepID=UPI003A8B9622